MNYDERIKIESNENIRKIKIKEQKTEIMNKYKHGEITRNNE